MDRDNLRDRQTPETETIAEGFRAVPGAEDPLEETEATKREPAPQEIYRPHEPGPHPRP